MTAPMCWRRSIARPRRSACSTSPLRGRRTGSSCRSLRVWRRTASGRRRSRRNRSTAGFASPARTMERRSTRRRCRRPWPSCRSGEAVSDRRQRTWSRWSRWSARGATRGSVLTTRSSTRARCHCACVPRRRWKRTGSRRGSRTSRCGAGGAARLTSAAPCTPYWSASTCAISRTLASGRASWRASWACPIARTRWSAWRATRSAAR